MISHLLHRPLHQILTLALRIELRFDAFAHQVEQRTKECSHQESGQSLGLHGLFQVIVNLSKRKSQHMEWSICPHYAAVADRGLSLRWRAPIRLPVIDCSLDFRPLISCAEPSAQSLCKGLCVSDDWSRPP